MAFQLAALVLPGDLTADPRGVFDRLGFEGGVEAGRVSFIEATSPQQSTRCIGSNGDWTMITDAMPFISLTSTAPVGSLWSSDVATVLRSASAEGRAFGFIMSKLSNNYGFSLFENGKHVRSYLEQMGNELVSTGSPLPAEKVAGAEDKQHAIFQLMKELEIPYHEFEKVRFHYFAFERNG